MFASNAFAIMGLRALYFLIADMHGRFRYLQEGLAIILAFVGVKMLVHEWYHIPTWLSLVVIAIVLTASIGFSLKAERAEAAGSRRAGPRRFRTWRSLTTTSSGSARRCRSST